MKEKKTESSPLKSDLAIEQRTSLANEVENLLEPIPTEKVEDKNPHNKQGEKVLSPKNGLKEFLENKGLEVIDKRNKGGALWLIGDKDLSPLIDELRKEKIIFTFANNGSKSTDKRPSWFTSYVE